MKKRYHVLSIFALAATLSITSAVAGITVIPGANAPRPNGPSAFALHGRPDMPPPLYEASLQTRHPDQALSKLIANAPQGADKNYEVRVMIRELPPEPEPTAPTGDK